MPHARQSKFGSPVGAIVAIVFCAVQPAEGQDLWPGENPTKNQVFAPYGSLALVQRRVRLYLSAALSAAKELGIPLKSGWFQQLLSWNQRTCHSKMLNEKLKALYGARQSLEDCVGKPYLSRLDRLIDCPDTKNFAFIFIGRIPLEGLPAEIIQELAPPDKEFSPPPPTGIKHL